MLAFPRIMVFSSIAVVVNCLNAGVGDLQLERKFWARKINLQSGASSQYQVSADLRQESKNVQIFVEKGNPISDAAVSGIIDVLENNIIPITHTWLAAPSDVDGNGKVMILLMDIDDGYQSGGSYIAGYFDAINQFADRDTQSQVQLRSNNGEMLYLDTYPSDTNSATFHATIAHEYQHLLQFSYTTLHGALEEAWVDEGLSEVVSDITGFGPQTSRIDYFRSAILASDSLIHFNNNDPLRDYASSYIYFRYIYDVYGLGGISAIFRARETGTNGVNAGIQALDNDILSHCGSTIGLVHPYFTCSYRLMWAGLVNTLGAMPATVHINFDGTAGTMNTGGAINYNWNVSNPNLKNAISASLTAGARNRPASSTNTGALSGYAPALFQTNYPTGSGATFNSCAGCGLTLIAGNNYFVVFNHNVSAATKTANVVDTQISSNTAFERNEPMQESFRKRKNSDRKIHWHFPLNAEKVKLLREEHNNKKRSRRK